MAVRKLEQLQAIRKAIDKLDGDLLAAARKIIELVGTDDVERLRAALESYLLPAAKLAASSAGELGAAAYNTWRYEDLGEKMETVTSSAYDEGKYLSAINAATKKPTVDEMLATLSGRIGYTSRASYSGSLFENGRRDPKKPRYARCPGSGETCQFCLMLASRGFEYSKGKLGENAHNHANCKCTYTCSWDPRPEAQGYDSKKYYDEWQASIDKEAKERAERNGTSIETERDSIMDRYKESAKRSKSAARKFANGNRMPTFHEFTELEMDEIKGIAKRIGIPPEMLSFGTGSQTSYDWRNSIINIRGDILPDLNSTNNRDRISVDAVLAHEYYGHGSYPGTRLEPQSWRDEFRASYVAAIRTPNLSDEDRAMLMVDAYSRASDAGFSLRYTDDYKRIVYGY